MALTNAERASLAQEARSISDNYKDLAHAIQDLIQDLPDVPNILDILALRKFHSQAEADFFALVQRLAEEIND